MKRKELLNHGRIRVLTEMETSAVVGGYGFAELAGPLAIDVINKNYEGTVRSNLTPSRKNIELVPTAGVELATY